MEVEVEMVVGVLSGGRGRGLRCWVDVLGGVGGGGGGGGEDLTNKVFRVEGGSDSGSHCTGVPCKSRATRGATCPRSTVDCAGGASRASHVCITCRT